MEKGKTVKRRPIVAHPTQLVNTGEAIHKKLGGTRGDLTTQKAKFGEGFKVTVSDHSPSWSWTHSRIELGIKGSELDVTMRAEDGRSGSDDPDRGFNIHNNETKEGWNYLDELRAETRPEWVQGFLGALAIAKAEIVSKK